MELIAINVSVIFAFGLVITLIVFKGLIEARDSETRKDEVELNRKSKEQSGNN